MRSVSKEEGEWLRGWAWQSGGEEETNSEDCIVGGIEDVRTKLAVEFEKAERIEGDIRLSALSSKTIRACEEAWAGSLGRAIRYWLRPQEQEPCRDAISASEAAIALFKLELEG